MTRLRATRAVSSDGAVTIQASSRLMDDYVYATDLTGETDLTAVQQADGTYSLLYLGASANVMSLRQDPNSDTGWSEETLGNSFSAGQVVGAVGASGQFFAFATGSNVAAPDIQVANRQASGGWGVWQPLAVDPAVPMFIQVIELAAFNVAGKVELFALLGPSPGHTGNTSLWRIQWNAAKPQWQYIADSDQTIIEACTISGVASVLFGNTAAASPVKVDLFTVAAPFEGEPVLLAASVALTSLAVGAQADNNSAVFAADDGYSSGLRQIQYLDGGHPGAGFVQIDTSVRATALAVGNAGITPLSLFALDPKGRLHFVASPVSGASDKDYDFFLRLNNILCATGKDGDAELIGYLPGKGLLRLWQSSPDGDDLGGWNQERIQYQPLNQPKLSQQSTYSTTLTFYDAQGVPIANGNVQLKSTEIVTAAIAGETLVLGPDQATACTTDAAGRLRITTPTNTLNVAGLSATLPGVMQANEDFAVTPNAGIQQRLRNITVAEVTKLVPPEFAPDADHIQKAVTEGMANIHDGPVQMVRRRIGARDLRTPLPVRAQPRQAFRFTVANGRAVYRTLTAEEADAAITEIAARRADPEFGFFDFFEDAVEAIGNAFKSAVDAVYDYVVKPIVTGFQLAFKWATDTLKIAWSGIVETVEAAFRFVETVFDAVKTFFKKLYDFFAWLLSNARKDIWATKQKFETTFNQGLAGLAVYAAQGASVSHTFFLNLENAINQAFAQIESDLGNLDANDGVDAKPPGGTETILEIIEDASSVANWFLDKVSLPLDTLLGLSVSVPANILQSAQSLITQIESQFVTEIITLINNFMNRLRALANSVDNFGNALLATIVGEAKDLINAILRILDSVTQAFFAFFANNLGALGNDVFGASINNFVLQALYDLMNPAWPGGSEQLTVLGLGALLCAFVTTTLYRIFFDAAPFPSDLAGRQIGAAATTEAGVLLILSGFLQSTLWGLFDLMLDVEEQVNVDLWKILTVLIFVPALMQFLTWPGGVGTSLPFSPAPAQAKSVAWLVGFAGPAFTLVWAALAAMKKVSGGPRGSVIGSACLCACGAGSMATNVWSLVENSATARPAEWIFGVAGPLSAIGKPVRYVVPPPANKFVLGIIDIVSDQAAGVAKIARGLELNETLHPVREIASNQ